MCGPVPQDVIEAMPFEKLELEEGQVLFEKNVNAHCL